MAEEANISQFSQELRRDLEWFAGVEDAEGLSAMLRSRVLKGSLDPSLLVQFEQRSRNRLLPLMRLAVLEALCEPSGEGRPWDTVDMPNDLLGSFLTSHARALLDAGYYQLAYDRVSEAIAELGDAGPSSDLLNLRGLCALSNGDYPSACKDFRAVVTAVNRDPTQFLDLLTAKHNLAASLRALGEYQEARKLEAEVVEARARLLGAEHPDTLTAKANLASSLRALGEYEEARKLEAEVLGARARLLGAEHPDTLKAKANLAKSLILGEYPDARGAETGALEDHPGGEKS